MTWSDLSLLKPCVTVCVMVALLARHHLVVHSASTKPAGMASLRVLGKPQSQKCTHGVGDLLPQRVSLNDTYTERVVSGDAHAKVPTQCLLWCLKAHAAPVAIMTMTVWMNC